MQIIKKIFGFQLFDLNVNNHNRPSFSWYYAPVSFLLWLLFIPLSLLHFLGFFKLLNLMVVEKRSLTGMEIEELKLVFGHSVKYSKIRIVQHSHWAKVGARHVNTKHLGFVFLNTIYFSRSIDTKCNLKDMAWLVHEVTHVSQYQKVGLVYIIKALRAQRNGGYFYKQNWLNSQFKAFNFEQQADIAKVCYLELKGGVTESEHLSMMPQLINQQFC